VTTTDLAPIAAPTDALTLAQGLAPRALASWASPRNLFKGQHLEAVRDVLVERRRRQDPVDFHRSLGQAHLTFAGEGGPAYASLRFMGGGETYALSQQALGSIAREVLPTRGLGFLTALAALGEKPRQLADVNFAVFSQANADKDKLHLFRSVLAAGPYDGRLVRSLHSTSYATYDNLELVEDLLASGYANFPVAHFNETDTGLRLRFLVEPVKELRQPVPMFEVWNSETGNRAVTVRPGAFRLNCTNGMHSVDLTGSQNRWLHRGDRERIRDGVRAIVSEGRVRASGLVDLYQRAVDIQITDAFAWMQSNFPDLTEDQSGRVRAALADETTTAGGNLASLVDAVTLAAQGEGDIYEQESMEMLGSRILDFGIAESLKSRDRVLVPA
jgi:hypothetical protein